MDIINNKFGPTFFKKNHAYGFNDIGNLYQSQNENIKLRGLNIIFNKNGEGKDHGSINALLIFNHNPLSDKQTEKAYQLARKESRNILKFLRIYLRGFDQVSEINKNNYFSILSEENLIPVGFNDDVDSTRGLKRQEAYYLFKTNKTTRIIKKIQGYR